MDKGSYKENRRRAGNTMNCNKGQYIFLNIFDELLKKKCQEEYQAATLSL